jgi:hypothetical protein
VKLKQIGYKARQIPQVQKIVNRGEVVDVPKELGEALLKHNTKLLTVWELVKSKKEAK